jgi:RNA polymerase sigma-70 factor, ECF subfamily
VAANGSPAYWQLRPGPTGVYEPFGLILLDVSDGLIAGITTYLDADRLMQLFGRTGAQELPITDSVSSAPAHS